VPFQLLGVATSNLTFFRQIGGSVALAIVGTIFGTEFQRQLGPQMGAAGVPPQVVAGFGQAVSSGAVDFNKLTGVGDLGTIILSSIPQQLQAAIAPFVPNIVAGIHQAFSLAVAQTFFIGVVAAAIAAVAAAAMREIPLRKGFSPEQARAAGITAETPATRDEPAPRYRELPARD
jgi:hypothetical protein